MIETHYLKYMSDTSYILSTRDTSYRHERNTLSKVYSEVNESSNNRRVN